MEVLSRGERSEAVSHLQLRLEGLGYLIPIEEKGGYFGAGTEAAVQAFQQRRGLAVDGRVGAATLAELEESSLALGDRLLQLDTPNMRGDDVLLIQASLNALGFSSGKHDGIFGPRTLEALIEFQRNLAIDEDGIVGPETLRALDRLRYFTRFGMGTGPRMREWLERTSGPPGITGKVIAIDPGHGGEDPGEIGPSGETESELAFALAANLALLLDEEGAETTLTRGPHNDPLELDRAGLANDLGAYLFVSIHLNSDSNSVASGAAAYFYEMQGVASEPGEHLAELMLRELIGLGLVDCRTHGKSYPILRETRMPAVLVEPGFITNPEDVKLLQQPRGMESIAEALRKAIVHYFSGGP